MKEAVREAREAVWKARQAEKEARQAMKRAEQEARQATTVAEGDESGRLPGASTPAGRARSRATQCFILHRFYSYFKPSLPRVMASGGGRRRTIALAVVNEGK